MRPRRRRAQEGRAVRIYPVHMRTRHRLALIAGLVLVGLALAAVASTKTFTVSITKNGFTPDPVQIAVGDVVTWQNTDTVNHQVVSSQVPFTSPVLTPGATYSHTFTKAGNFSITDPLAAKGKPKMTVRVGAAAVTVALAAAKPLVVYGNRVTLTGTVSTLQANEQVSIWAKPCGATNASKLTTVASIAGGAYTALVKPLKNTIFTAQAKGATSAGASVTARPRLTLVRPASGRYVVTVRGSNSFSGRAVVLQRWNASLSRWVNLKSTVLVKGPPATLPTVLSRGTFRAKLAKGTRLRVSISQVQVGSCYRPGFSNVALAG